MLKGRSRLAWFFAALAPWSLALGLIMSFAAEADQDAIISASLAAMTNPAPHQPIDLVGGRAIRRLERAGLSHADHGAFLQNASLEMEAYSDLQRQNGDDEVAPQIVLKQFMLQDARHGGKALPFPAVDRSAKADAIVALRPGFDAKLRSSSNLREMYAQTLVFGTQPTSAASVFTIEPGDAPGPETVATFEPWGVGESPTTIATASDASPTAGASVITVFRADVHLVRVDGSTPKVPRSVALGSVTPVALDTKPIEFATSGAGTGKMQSTAVPKSNKPDFAGLIAPKHLAAEEHCLAQAIYFEARSENPKGQAAVAQVIFNRVKSGLYPSTVCGVVFQNRQHHNACQFSFACNGHPLVINDQASWRRAVEIATAVTGGETYIAKVGGATHYHANYVNPRWARKLERMDVIGHHIFYKLHPGQT